MIKVYPITDSVSDGLACGGKEDGKQRNGKCDVRDGLRHGLHEAGH